MSPAGWVRAARAAAFAVVCVTVSAAGHAWMAGSSVPPLGLLAGAVAVFVPAIAVAGRERRWTSITGALLVGEAGLHLLFDATSAAPMNMPGPAMPVMPGMSPTSSTGLTLDTLLRGTAGMLVAHVAAALLCGWWLRAGERALFELLRLLTSTVAARVRRLLAARTTALPAERPAGPPPDPGLRPADAGILRDCVVRRGPPLVTAFHAI